MGCHNIAWAGSREQLHEPTFPRQPSFRGETAPVLPLTARAGASQKVQAHLATILSGGIRGLATAEMYIGGQVMPRIGGTEHRHMLNFWNLITARLPRTIFTT